MRNVKKRDILIDCTWRNILPLNIDFPEYAAMGYTAASKEATRLLENVVNNNRSWIKEGIPERLAVLKSIMIRELNKMEVVNNIIVFVDQ